MQSQHRYRFFPTFNTMAGERALKTAIQTLSSYVAHFRGDDMQAASEILLQGWFLARDGFRKDYQGHTALSPHWKFESGSKPFAIQIQSADEDKEGNQGKEEGTHGTEDSAGSSSAPEEASKEVGLKARAPDMEAPEAKRQRGRQTRGEEGCEECAKFKQATSAMKESSGRYVIALSSEGWTLRQDFEL